ncbi:hypothetical protein HMPREF3293_00915 [Christensenella minuta]|uniref:Uncharacterized protein n=1 Tax=Christensenella minuta TaxID=626937 RepID=A0A136Q6C0_9FIRM|nr:hypothetical protein HMPREF3293_00915 [Christensenella minuta]
MLPGVILAFYPDPHAVKGSGCQKIIGLRVSEGLTIRKNLCILCDAHPAVQRHGTI